jgi:hypothetical protein
MAKKARKTSRHDKSKATNPSIGEYLIQRLQDYAVDDAFGIPIRIE